MLLSAGQNHITQTLLAVRDIALTPTSNIGGQLTPIFRGSATVVYFGLRQLGDLFGACVSYFTALLLAIRYLLLLCFGCVLVQCAS